MNLHATFMQLWSAKFPGANDLIPGLECLKADQFLTVNEQRAALEVAQSEILSSAEALKERLNQQMFIADYLRSCITKLGAVSRVFSELEESGFVESDADRTIDSSVPNSNRSNIVSGSSAHDSRGGATITTSASSVLNFSGAPMLPSFFQTASPLLSAATRNFLFQSALSHPISTESQVIKSRSCSEMNTVTSLSPSLGRPPTASCPTASLNLPNVTVEEAVRRLVDDMSGIPASSSSAFHNRTSSPVSTASTTPNRHSREDSHQLHNNFNAARAAAAAVSAALSLHLNHSATGTDLFHGGGGISPLNVHKTSPPLVHFKPGSPGGGSELINSNRPYQCATCGRGFAVKAGLMQHLRTHTDERPYPCPECGRAFKQKIQLTTHMRVHSGERPYGCRVCGKLFRQQSHVVQHLRTHTGEKPHKCSRCNKAFRQKYSLISHQRRMCQSRANSAANSVMAGMTMWIGPGVTGERVCEVSRNFKSSIVSTKSESNASLPQHLPDDHSTLSNRSCSPASSHELALTSDGSKADLTTPSYHSDKQLSPEPPALVANGQVSTETRSFLDSEYSAFSGFPSSNLRMNVSSASAATTTGAFPVCLEEPMESSM